MRRCTALREREAKARDPFRLLPPPRQMGRDIVTSLQRLRGPCGFAMVSDVDTGELADSMESFFLSETVKYLFLLFDAGAANGHAGAAGGMPRGANFVDGGKGQYVFTTEGHMFPLKPELMFQKKKGPEARARAAVGEVVLCGGSSVSAIVSTEGSSQQIEVHVCAYLISSYGCGFHPHPQFRCCPSSLPTAGSGRRRLRHLPAPAAPLAEDALPPCRARGRRRHRCWRRRPPPSAPKRGQGHARGNGPSEGRAGGAGADARAPYFDEPDRGAGGAADAGGPHGGDGGCGESGARLRVGGAEAHADPAGRRAPREQLSSQVCT